MNFRTHYDNLKVSRDAPAEVIQASYRALSKKFHPDLNPHPDAAKIMGIINASYALLSDPTARAAYDRYLHDRLSQQPQPSAATSTPSPYPPDSKPPRLNGWGPILFLLACAPVVGTVMYYKEAADAEEWWRNSPISKETAPAVPLDYQPETARTEGSAPLVPFRNDYRPTETSAPVPLPPTVPFNEGLYSLHTKEARLAPLSIATPGGPPNKYYIKIVDPQTDMTVMTLAAHSNSKIEVKVPLGTYTIRYATGNEWYGPDHLFGPTTSTNKLDELFIFEASANQYMGYDVELIQKTDGNLSTSEIPPSDF